MLFSFLFIYLGPDFQKILGRILITLIVSFVHPSVISVVVFQLQLQLQLWFFSFTSSFSYYFISVTISVISFFSYSYSYSYLKPIQILQTHEKFCSITSSYHQYVFEISTYKFTKLHVTSFIVQCQSVTGTHCSHYSLHTSDTVTRSTCGCILEMHAFPDP